MMNFTQKISLILVSIITLFAFQGFAQVTSQDAATVAVNYVSQRAQSFENNQKFQAIDIIDINSEKNKTTQLYIVNLSPEGWAIVTANNNVYPVLAYSFEGNIDLKNPAPAFNFWLDNYKENIDFVRTNSVKSNENNIEWNKYLSSTFTPNATKTILVAPLVRSLWNQDNWYNALCPEDAAGPGGRAYAGCVATAAAQIMHFHRYPSQGSHYNSYSSPYGILSVDFSQATYDWDQMFNIIPGPNNEMAEIQYHMGVAIDMEYSANGSSAQTSDVENALKYYFGYATADYKSKSFYTTAQWKTLLKQNIDDNMPMEYSGFPSSGSGHAFVCDGYDDQDYFHFNYGWSGSYNGYYSLSAINAGSYDFSSSQKAVVDIFPGANYGSGCQSGMVLSESSGSFEDGSGSEDYAANQSCNWLISPLYVQNITLDVQELKFGTGDYLYVYDGADATASVLAVFDQNSTLNLVTSTQDKMYIEFITNASDNGDGFYAEYESRSLTYCSGTTYLTDISNTISDGSGAYEYNNNSNCKWIIHPYVEAKSISIDFTQLDVEDTLDYISLIDTRNNSLVGKYSGNNIPATINFYGPELMVNFRSNSIATAEGWELTYNSVPLSLNEELEDITLNVYPNPASNNVTVNIELNANNANIQIAIYSLDGSCLYNVMEDNNNGRVSKTINLNEFSKGIYLLNISGNNIYKTEKLIVY